MEIENVPEELKGNEFLARRFMPALEESIERLTRHVPDAVVEAQLEDMDWDTIIFENPSPSEAEAPTQREAGLVSHYHSRVDFVASGEANFRYQDADSQDCSFSESCTVKGTLEFCNQDTPMGTATHCEIIDRQLSFPKS